MTELTESCYPKWDVVRKIFIPSLRVINITNVLYLKMYSTAHTTITGTQPKVNNFTGIC